MSKSCNNAPCGKKTSIGGQALIEGIMMRGPKVTAMAVRNPQGEIVLEKWETKALTKAKITKLPVVRGVFNFVSSMIFGYRCLMRSAEIAGLEEAIEEEEKEKQAKKAAKKAKKKEMDPQSEEPARETETSAEPQKESSVMMGAIMVIATVLGVLLAVGLFILLPSFIYKLLSDWLPFLPLANSTWNSLVKSVFEGLLKITILVLYMLLVSRMKEIKRTFQYHGAEHMTIFCYEHGKELTVENVRNERRFHPRCGTSFLILMLLVGIFIGFLIDPLFTLIFGNNFLLDGWAYTAIRAGVKLLLLPLIMGIGYELIKLAGRRDNAFTRVISAPGMWLQRVTVLTPTDDMIECAITAFKEVIPDDNSDRF